MSNKQIRYTTESVLLVMRYSLCVKLFVIFLGVCPNFSIAQTDTIPPILVDSLSEALVLDKKAQRKKDKKEKNGLIKRLRNNKYPNPTRAAFLSLALPGAGQFYNKKYWKIPIVYVGIGGLTWLAIDQQKEYNKYKQYYIFKVRDEPNTLDNANLTNINAATLKGYRNALDKRRQQAYAGILAFWVLGAVDAFVDAHLLSFDVSEDLSLQLSPTVQPNPWLENSNWGLQFVLSPKSVAQEIPLVFFGE